jgi:DnaK suppressor protein
MSNIIRMTIEEDYHPSEDEQYMNEKQLAYFQKKLLSWKEELLKESSETLRHLQEELSHETDFHDRANLENDTSFELRTRDRYRKLISKIDSALERIKLKEYGFCEETGEIIGLTRLEARPIATLTIEAQERHENYEKQHNEEYY